MNMNAAPRHLLLFDFDGVVVDSRAAFHAAYAGACRAVGRPELTDDATFLDVFSTNMVAGLERLGISNEALDVFKAVLKQELLGRIDSIPCFPGMLDLLALAQARHSVRILTSNLTAIVQAYLKRAGLDPLPEVLGVDVEPSKVIKIRQARAREPELKAFYIGDTAGDMLEGREGGATPVGVAWGWHGEARLREAGADLIVRCPKELLEL